MKILLHGETSLMLVPQEGMLTFEAESATQQVSSFHLLGSALAMCTFTVLHSWAQHAGLGAHDLHLNVEWDFGENPHRLTNIRMQIHWPSLPDARRAAALRAADLCAIHATLTSTVKIATTVNS